MKKKLFLVAYLFSPSLILNAALVPMNFEYPPSEENTTSGAPTLIAGSSSIIDADFEKDGFVSTVFSTIPVSKVQLRFNAVTTGDTLDWRIETVDPVTGMPSGNLYCTNSSGTWTVTLANAATWSESNAITADCTLGGPFAFYITRISGGSANFSITKNIFNSDYGYYVSSNTTVAGGWVKASNKPNFNFKMKDGSFVKPFGASSYQTVFTTFTTAASLFIGNKFTSFPFRGRLTAIHMPSSMQVPFRIGVYSGATEITGVNVSTAIHSQTNMFFQLSTPTIINAGDTFKVLMSSNPSSAANNSFYIGGGSTQTIATGLYGQVYEMGTNLVATNCKDATNLATCGDSTEQRFLMYLIFDQIDLNANQNIIKNATLKNTTIK